MGDNARFPKEDPSGDRIAYRRTEDFAPPQASLPTRYTRARGTSPDWVPSVSSRDPPTRLPRTSLPEATIGPLIEEARPQAPPPSYDGTILQWECALTELWLQPPGEVIPVFGWFREEGAPYPDAFFGTDGTYRPMSRSYMEKYQVHKPPTLYLNRMIHPALQQPARAILTDRFFSRDPDSAAFRRPIEGDEWREIILPGFPTSLSYGFNCVECQQIRTVRRDLLPHTETLSREYRFHCRDVGVLCHTPNPRGRLSFLPTRPIPGLNTSSAPKATLLPPSSRSPFLPNVLEESPRYEEVWRKRMKFWAGAVTYDGSPSLVQLKGWEASLKEAFETVGVPQGRPRVLQGIHYLTGEAEKWWRSIAGQPQGQALIHFDDLTGALQRRFIPRSVYAKAMDDWSTLKQTGTAEEYMRRVDELSTLMPLGEVAEYAHALRGMRVEIRAEIEFHLKELGITSCRREEL